MFAINRVRKSIGILYSSYLLLSHDKNQNISKYHLSIQLIVRQRFRRYLVITRFQEPYQPQTNPLKYSTFINLVELSTSNKEEWFIAAMN